MTNWLLMRAPFTVTNIYANEWIKFKHIWIYQGVTGRAEYA